MAGKSKGKQKPLQVTEVSVSKTAADNAKALEITQRLRKGRNLEPLLKEAEKLAENQSSAISQLCHAKVALAQAMEGIMTTSLTETETRPAIHDREKSLLGDALKAAREGALHHSSILCGRFYYRLAEVLTPNFEGLPWPPRVDGLTDPHTELLEQGPHLCDFETWKEWKKLSSQEVKLKIRLEMEKAKSSSQRHSDSAPDIAEGIMRSGLLYDSLRQHVSHALNKRQSRLQTLHKTNAQLFQQLNNAGQLQELDFGHHFERVKSADDDDNARSAKQDGLEKRQKQKRESEIEMRRQWFEEVVEFVKQEVTQHSDNELRLASLVQITSIPLGDIVSGIAAGTAAQLEPKSASRAAEGLKCLRPEEGGICQNTAVFYDDNGHAEPMHKAEPRLRIDIVSAALKESPYESKDSSTQAHVHALHLATEVWEKAWNSWPGQVPPDMSPVDSLSELKGCLESFPAEYRPLPLDEPSHGLHSLATSQLLPRLNHFGVTIDSERMSSGLLEHLRCVTRHKARNMEVLQDISSDCCQALPNSTFDYTWPAFEVSEFLPVLDLAFDLDVTVAEQVLSEQHKRAKFSTRMVPYLAQAQHLGAKVNAKKHLKKRGQQAVSLAELTPQVVHDPGRMQELESLWQSDQEGPEIFRLESRLEGRLISASELEEDGRADELNGRSVDSDDMSDGGSTEDLENGHGHSEQGSARAWWSVVSERFPNEQIRAAILEEIRLAALVLLDNQHFSSGIALAVSSHIYSFLELEEPEDFEGPVLLDHARMLGVEPLKALLDFLWLQLGFRWSTLRWCIEAAAQLGVTKNYSSFEILSDDTVRYSPGALKSIKCSMETEQRDQAVADPQSPVRLSVLQSGQAEPPLDIDQMSPKQLQEAVDQHIEHAEQLQKHHQFCGAASVKPEVNEEYVRYFVQRVLFAETPDQAEQEAEPDETGLMLQQSRLNGVVAEAVHVARMLADSCALLAWQLDLHEQEQYYPHRDTLNDYGRRELLSQLDPADGHIETMHAILASINLAATRKVATQLPIAATNLRLNQKRGQELRAKSVQGGFKRMHMENLQNMGAQSVASLADLCKGKQLYNPSIIGIQEAGEHLGRVVLQDSAELKEERYHLESEKEQAELACKVTRALETYQYFQRSLGAQGARQQLQQDGTLHVQKSLKKCVDSIMRLSVNLDMLMLQISINQTCRSEFVTCKCQPCSLCMESRCDSLESILQHVHNEMLRNNLIKVAKENKVRMDQQAAERNAQELLATEAQSKSHLEGEKKKGKKKKKAAKQREDKQEESLLQELQSTQELQEQEPNEEVEWEEAVTNVVANLPPGLQHAGSGSKSPKGSQPEKDEDYWRRLQGGQSQQDEDWSTVDKKKGGKGKAGSKQPDAASATAASAIPSSWEEDGWEDHVNLLDAPRPTPPGLHPRVDAKPSSNDENTQPGQEPATPNGRSNPDVQCEKCGRWGHSEQHCSEQYCDLCSMHGHSTLACPKKSLRAAGRGAGEQEKGRESHRGQHEPSRPQLCHSCGQPGHIAATCPVQKCYNCQQLGHKGYNCPNPSVPRPPGSASRTVPLGNSRRREGDAQSSDRQQGAEQAGEQSRGRRKGRGRDQQADASSSGSATLPMTKPGRRGQASKHAQQDLAAEYPSLTGQTPGTSFPDSGPGAPSTAGFGPQPPPPPPPREANPQWGPARSAPNQLDPRVARPSGKGGRARTSGWGQSEPLHEQAAGHTWDDEEDDDGSSFHSMPASPMRHSPHRSQPTPMQGPAGVAWGSTNRPSSARSLGPGDFSDRISQGSGASVSGQGHAALPHGLLQPGMNSVQPSAWAGVAFAPHSTDPQLGLALPDQLVPQQDPVVSPGFMHRSAPARPFQPGAAFNPAAPLLSYVQQETRDHAPRSQALTPAAGLGPAATSANMPSADDIFLNDILAGQEEDNKPVGIYAAPAAAAPAAAAPAAAALWPALDALPVPGQNSWAARLEARADAALDPGQEDEADEELQKALQASLEETQSEQKQTAYAAELLRPSASHEPATTSTMGLRNATGEYNCFLNVIIQCMWHCHVFRQAVMSWDHAAYQDKDVVRALIALFKAFAKREKSNAPSQAVDPTQLREALGNLEGDKFKVGQMGDAAEVLTALYEKLAGVAAEAGQPSMLDDNFGLHVKETVWCERCKKDSHQHSYVQYFFNVMSYSLAISQVVGGCASFGETLKDLEGQTTKSCDTDKGGCNRMYPVQHYLVGTPPHVFTMQLAWQSNNEKGSEIKLAMEALSQTLDLGDVYDGIEKREHIYHLRSMVCYYGQHYLAFVLMPGNTWFMFDDASMLRVGSWADVINKSALGRTQASVLFFEHE